MLEEKILNKYASINLLERYKSLSEAFNSKEVIEHIDQDQVMTFLKGLNCRFSYNKKEDFFGMIDQVDDFDFRFNLSIKYGSVEPIIWGKNVCTEEQFGGVLIRVTKLIQISKGMEPVERIKKPRIGNQEDLEKIIVELYKLYEDFKLVLSSKEDQSA